MSPSRTLEQKVASKTKRALVVIRCGDNSLHPEYVNSASEFDVVLSYFGNAIPYDLANVQYVHYYKGSKWEGLNHFFSSYPEVWQEYDYIWLPDDDLSSDAQNINQFLEICDKEQFDLAQPALTHNSYKSFLITIQVQGLLYRRTNFVEIMAPLFSRQALEICAPSFAENKSGFGLEFLWRKLLSGRKLGIIDKTPVYHTRPVGSAGNGVGQYSSISRTPKQEKKSLFRKYRLFAKNKKCFAAVTESGKSISDVGELRKLIRKGLPVSEVDHDQARRKIYRMVCSERQLKYIFW